MLDLEMVFLLVSLLALQFGVQIERCAQRAIPHRLEQQKIARAQYPSK
jgi:hypothetical protein